MQYLPISVMISSYPFVFTNHNPRRLETGHRAQSIAKDKGIPVSPRGADRLGAGGFCGDFIFPLNHARPGLTRVVE